MKFKIFAGLRLDFQKNVYILHQEGFKIPDH